MKNKTYFFTSLLILNCHSILADEDATSDSTLLITGSPIQQSIQGATDQLDEYDNQAIIDAGDLLTRFPGFSAIRAGGHAIDPVLRGQSQTRINLLQQGAFLHGAGPNRMDSPGSYTEPFGWDELQIIKGIESLIFGSGGPAGTLNFKRYRPSFDEDNMIGKVMAVYSPDYYKVGADLATGNQQGYLRLISQRHDQESYQDGDGNTTRTAFKTTSNTLVAGYTPDQQSELRFTYMANQGKDALFAGTMMDGPKTDMDAAQLLYIDGLQNSDDVSEYQIYWNSAHHIMDNYSLREQTSPMRMLTDSHSDTSGAKWLKRWTNEQTVWQVSADWQNIDRHAERFMGMMGTPEMLQSRIWPDNELDIKGIATEVEYRFSSDKRLKSGIRYDQVQADFEQAVTMDTLSLYQSYYANTPTETTENNFNAFSRYYQQFKDNLYWAGVSSTVRTADATERYIAADNNAAMMRWIGNPDIQPERHNQLELGAKWHFQNGWHELNIYHDQVADFILRDRARLQQGILMMDMATIYRNVGATLQGFEWALNTSFGETWNFYTNLAYVKGENKDSGQSLYQIPPVEGLFQLSQQSDRLGYWLDIKWALSQNDVDDNMMTGSGLDSGSSDGWLAADFKLSYELENDRQISFGVNNIFDKTYAYHVSRANLDPFNPEAILVNEPGRQFWISILASGL